MGLLSSIGKFITNPVGSIIGSGVSAIGSVATTAMNNKATANENEKNRQHDIDMFNMENEANRKNWQDQFDATNAYNTPAAQAQRMREAGINPALAASNGQLNAGNASSSGIPNASASSTPGKALDFNGIADSSNMVMDAMFKAAQIDAINSASYRDRTQAEMTARGTPAYVAGMEADAGSKKYDYELKKRTWRQRSAAENIENENRVLKAEAESPYIHKNAFNEAQKLSSEAAIAKISEKVAGTKISFRGKEQLIGIAEKLAALDNVDASTKQYKAAQQQLFAAAQHLFAQARSVGLGNARSALSNDLINKSIEAISKDDKLSPLEKFEKMLTFVVGGTTSESSSYSGGVDGKIAGIKGIGVQGSHTSSKSTTIGAQR